MRGGRWGKEGPSLAHHKAPHFWGQVRQLRKMNGASLASPGNLLEKVERRREREGRKEGGSECSANYSRPLFSLLPSPSLFFSPVARSLPNFHFNLTAHASLPPSLRPPSIHLSVSTHAHGIFSAEE